MGRRPVVAVVASWLSHGSVSASPAIGGILAGAGGDDDGSLGDQRPARPVGQRELHLALAGDAPWPRTRSTSIESSPVGLWPSWRWDISSSRRASTASEPNAGGLFIHCLFGIDPGCCG